MTQRVKKNKESGKNIQKEQDTFSETDQKEKKTNDLLNIQLKKITVIKMNTEDKRTMNDQRQNLNKEVEIIFKVAKQKSQS